MDAERLAAPWLRATIRGVVLGAALGGGLFVLSQLVGPDDAHAETVSAEAGSLTTPPSADGALGGVADGALGGVADGGLGGVTAGVDRVIGDAGSDLAAATQPLSGVVSHVVSESISALPPAAGAPVKQITTPVTGAVRAATTPIANTIGTSTAAKPVSSIAGGAAGVVDHVVASVEQHAGTVGSGLTSTGTALGSELTSAPQRPGDSAGPVVGDDGRDSAASAASEVADASGGTAVPSDAPFAPPLTAPSDSWTHRSHAAPARAAAAVGAAASPAPGDGAPGLPSTPQAAAPAPSGAGAGTATAASGGQDGSGPGQAPAALGFVNLPAVSAGLSSLSGGGALPASPVFDHDSTPD